MTGVGCWAHARRKFDEAIKAAGTVKSHAGGAPPGGKARQGLGFIQQLYQVERRAREKQLTPHERHALRQEHAVPVISKLHAWLKESLPTVPPGSATGKALGYLHNQWERLTRYLEDGRLELDNNRVENAIRPFVVGRKGWLFSDSVAGANASANLYSLLETAKANGHDPFFYLRHVLNELPKAQTAEEFEALLPMNIAPATLIPPR